MAEENKEEVYESSDFIYGEIWLLTAPTFVSLVSYTSSSSAKTLAKPNYSLVGDLHGMKSNI